MSKVVFRKTAKGTEEMASRTQGLTPRVRRMLILVDGKRTVSQLRELVAADDLTHSLSLLEETGLIEMISAPSSTAGSSVSSEPVPPVNTFRDSPPPHDPMRLQMSRNFMTNTIKVFFGTVGTSALLTRIEEATSLEQLRECYGSWHHLILSSRDGRREIESLREKLLTTL
jgi:hypothetical protein